MKREIKLDRIRTNLQVGDKVERAGDEYKYRVAYIDYNTAKAVFISLTYVNQYLVVDLNRHVGWGKISDFSIIYD